MSASSLPDAPLPQAGVENDAGQSTPAGGFGDGFRCRTGYNRSRNPGSTGHPDPQRWNPGTLHDVRGNRRIHVCESSGRLVSGAHQCQGLCGVSLGRVRRIGSADLRSSQYLFARDFGRHDHRAPHRGDCGGADQGRRETAPLRDRAKLLCELRQEPRASHFETEAFPGDARYP